MQSMDEFLHRKRRLTLRDALWAFIVLATMLGWYCDARRLRQEILRCRYDLNRVSKRWGNEVKSHDKAKERLVDVEASVVSFLENVTAAEREKLVQHELDIAFQKTNLPINIHLQRVFEKAVGRDRLNEMVSTIMSLSVTR